MPSVRPSAAESSSPQGEELMILLGSAARRPEVSQGDVCGFSTLTEGVPYPFHELFARDAASGPRSRVWVRVKCLHEKVA